MSNLQRFITFWVFSVLLALCAHSQAAYAVGSNFQPTKYSRATRYTKPEEYHQLQSLKVQEPNYVNMAADLLLARPLLLGATAAGAVIFVVSSPLSLLGGNLGEAAHDLVGVPGKATFFRCLGCVG